MNNEETKPEVCQKCGGEGIYTVDTVSADGEHNQFEQVCECQFEDDADSDMSGATEGDR